MSDETLPATIPPGQSSEIETAAETRSTSVARGLGLGSRGVLFTTVNEAVAYATACFNSRLLPEHIKNGQQAFVIMDNGRELGLKPWASWKLIYITRQGRIAIMSKGALAVAQASPRFENYEERIEFEGTPEMRAVAVAKARGFKAVEKTFSLADAKAAGLSDRKKNREGREYDGPWQAYEKDMLLARARDRALAIAFAAELGGIEPETIAEDADRLEAGARPTPAPAAIIGVPREAANEAAPKALPEGKPDPLLLHVLGKKAAETTQIPTRDRAQGQQKEPERIPDRADEAGASPEPGLRGGKAESAQGRPGELLEGEARRSEIDKSVDEAFPQREPEPKKEPKGRKGRKEYKVGDIINGTRRVVEVADGIPIVEKLTDEELAELKQRVSEAKPDPTRPPYPAHYDEGVWYCDAHNAYGCSTCSDALAAEQRPKKCPRPHCGMPLNLLGDCDNCGFPNARYE